MKLLKLLGGFVLIFFGIIGIIANLNEPIISIIQILMNTFILAMGILVLIKGGGFWKY